MHYKDDFVLKVILVITFLACHNKSNCCIMHVLTYLEIPLFHVLNAKVTFGNIGGVESPVNGVHAIKYDIHEIDGEGDTLEQEDQSLSLAARCVIESTCFEAPAEYREVNLDQPVGKCIVDDSSHKSLLLIIQ